MVKSLEYRLAQEIEREDRMWTSTLIDALPPALRNALGLSMIAYVERHWHDVSFRYEHGYPVESALAALTAPLVEQSARRWRRNLKPYALFVVEAWLLEPRQEPTCAAWGDSGGVYAALSLPSSWFTDVWARGVALIDDFFVLGATLRPADPTRMHVRALRWERYGPQISRSVQAPAVATRGSDREWHLQWA